MSIVLQRNIDHKENSTHFVPFPILTNITCKEGISK